MSSSRLVLAAAVGGILLCACGGSAAAAPFGTSGQQRGGTRPVAVLDPSFGSGGSTRVPLESPATSALGASTKDGGLIVGGGNSIELLSNSGGTGASFGSVGSLALPAAAGREFALADFAVDPQGRLLVVGTSYYPEAENASPEREGGTRAFRPAALRILRFLPAGGLDPTFGKDGVVESDLGLPAPLATNGRRLGSRPAERATGIAVDPQGRIVVTGDAVVRLGRACSRNSFAPGVVKVGFVARFGEDGSSDPSFGAGGLVGGRHLEELPLGAEVIEEPVLGRAGTVSYRASAINPCVKDKSHLGIGQLTQTGRARNAFGMKGALIGRYDALAGGPGGSVLALAEIPRRDDEGFKARVTKFAPNGRIDVAFGDGGSATVRLGPGRGAGDLLDAITVDSQGRILVGGSYGNGHGPSIAIVRLSSTGKQEMNFGRRGLIATPIPGLGDPSSLFFDSQGRLVAIHPYGNITNDFHGLIVVRYVLRN